MRSTSPGFMSFSYDNPFLARFGDEFFRSIPPTPGVYFMHHADGQILYIGKAKNLRNRLSWYKNTKSGSTPENTLELIENVARIRWETLPSEQEALSRESELLHAVRPPFNIAGTWPQPYLYIGFRTEADSCRQNRIRVHFQLTRRRELIHDYRIFGCFKHRSWTKVGYTALLRLLFAASFPTHSTRRFSFPARILVPIFGRCENSRSRTVCA